MNNYNPKNCDRILRRVWHGHGITVTLNGHHAKKWSVCIMGTGVPNRLITLNDRNSGINEYRKTCAHYRTNPHIQ